MGALTVSYSQTEVEVMLSNVNEHDRRRATWNEMITLFKDDLDIDINYNFTRGYVSLVFESEEDHLLFEMRYL